MQWLILLCCSLWCMKFCILAVYATIVETLPLFKPAIKYIWAFLALTWVAALVIQLLECRPFDQ